MNHNINLDKILNFGKKIFYRIENISDDLLDRASIAKKYLSGTGIEIGALHNPLKIPPDCTVKYVDYKTLLENRCRYPELKNEKIVETDIIDDGFILDKIEDNSLDFIIANHALEHSPDSFGTLNNWLTKLRERGIIFVGVPIAESCFDKGRLITSLEHIIKDNDLFISLNKKNILQTTKDHVWEFICISDKNIRAENKIEETTLEDRKKYCNRLINELEQSLLIANNYNEIVSAHIAKINRNYDIHYHTFTFKSYRLFLQYFCDKAKCKLENVVNIGNNECIGIIRKQLN